MPESHGSTLPHRRRRSGRLAASGRSWPCLLFLALGLPATVGLCADSTSPGASAFDPGQATAAVESISEPDFRILWKMDLAGWAHMMVIHEGVVYTQWTEGSLSMVDLRTGRLLGSVAGVANGTAPVVVGNRVYSFRPSQLFELDATTLELLRRSPLPSATYSENMSYDAETGSVFLRRNDEGNGLLSAFRLQDGSKIWDTGFYLGRSPNNSSSPLSVGDDSVYVQGSDGTNHLWRLDKRTGDVRWVAALGKGNYDEFNNPIYDRGRDVIYSSGFWGECSAVRREDGKVLWTSRFPDYQIRSTLTYHDGVVYVPLYNGFKPQEPGACVALDADTGRTIWFRPARPGDDGWTATAVCDRYLYKLTHGYEGHIVVQDRATGELVWSTDVGQGQPCTNPVQSEGIVVFGGVSSLIALKVGTGQRVNCPWHGVYGTGYNPGAIIWDGAEKHPDVDADGMPDSWEVAKFGHLFADGAEDPDQDGLSNLEEFGLLSDPHSTTLLDQIQTLSFDLPLVLPITAPPVPLSAETSSGLNVSFRILAGPGRVENGRLVVLGTGVIQISAEQPGSRLFRPVVVERTLEVVPAEQQLLFEAPAGWRIPDSPITVSVRSSSGLPVRLELVAGPGRLEGTQLHLWESGEVTIRAEQDGNEVYQPAAAEWKVPVIRGLQNVVFTLPPEVAATNAPLPLRALTASGLPVDFRVVSGPAAIVGGRLVLGGTGVVRVAAEQPGDSAYEPAVEIQELLVHAAEQTIEFDAPPQRLASETRLRLVARASSGLPVTLTLVEGTAMLQENELLVLGPGRVVVRAEQAGNAFFRRSSTSLILNGERLSQTVEEFVLPSEVTTTNAPIRLAATSSSGLPVSFRVLEGPARVENRTLVLLGAGKVCVAAEQAGNLEYLAASLELEMLVRAASQEIAFEPPTLLFLTNPPVALAATASSGLPLQFEVVTGPAVVEGNLLKLRGAGELTVRASQPGNELYLPATAERLIQVERAPQRLTFSVPARMLATNGPVRLDAISNSGLPITYRVSHGPATITDGSLTVSGSGWVEVLAEQAGNKVFLPAAVACEVLVKPAPQVIRCDLPDTLLLTASPVKIEATATSGLPVQFSVLSGPAVLRDDLLTLLDDGVVALRIQQNGDARYSPVSLERLITVAKPTPAAVLRDWLARRAPELPADQRGPEADPDGDGARNLLEFLMGTNPADAHPGDGRLPSGQFSRQGEEEIWEVVFAVNPEFPAWLDWRLEVCAPNPEFEWHPLDRSVIEQTGNQVRIRLPVEPGGRLLRLAVPP